MIDPSAVNLAALQDRALGAYLGLAIGDALGASVEYMTPREIADQFADQGGLHRHIIGGGWLKLAPGQVTDDTTMSLALGEALLRGPVRGRAVGDPQIIAEAFLAWWRGMPVDCGNTCRRGIERFAQFGTLSAEPSEGDAGNGALMRNLPVALATWGDEAAFERISLAQARVTHHHTLSDAAVLGMGHLLRALLGGDGAIEIDQRIAGWVQAHPAFAFAPYPGRASAYVVDTVQTVLHAFTTQPSFEGAMLTAVNQGEDAGTNGALLGMLAGARCGATGLPQDWLDALGPQIRQDITEQTRALLDLSERA